MLKKNMDIKSKAGINFDLLLKMVWTDMIIMAPVFAVMAGIEHVIAKLTGFLM